jgi:hypothetical protein
MTRAAATMDTKDKVCIRGSLTLVMTRRTFRRVFHYPGASSTIISCMVNIAMLLIGLLCMTAGTGRCTSGCYDTCHCSCRCDVAMLTVGTIIIMTGTAVT